MSKENDQREKKGWGVCIYLC